MPHGLKRLNLSVGACFRIVDGFAEVGFDVDVGNGGLPVFFFQCVFDAIGNFVGFNDGQVRIYFDVEVEDVDVSVFASSQMMICPDAVHLPDYAGNFFRDRIGKRHFEQFPNRRQRKPVCHKPDEHADDGCGYRVEHAPLVAEKHGASDAYQYGDA